MKDKNINFDKENIKKETKKLRNKAKETINDYKKFAVKGNAIELAIGIVIGSAFTGIVNAIVNCIINPIISLFTNKVDISNLFVALDGNTYETIEEAKKAGAAIISYGELISSIINFIILSIVLFLMLKYITSVRNKIEKIEKKENDTIENEIKATTKVCPYCISEINIEATRCPCCTSELEKIEKKQKEVNKKKN